MSARDPKIIVVSEVHGLVGRDGQLAALIDGLAAGTRAEPGCTAYRVLRAEGAGEYVLISEWSGEAALRAHYATDHYAYYRSHVTELLASPSDVTVHTIAGTIHPVDPNLPDPGLLG